MHNLFFHCWMLVQRMAKVMLEYHETVIFLTENPQIIAQCSLSGTHPCEDNNWDDICFSLAIVLLANVMFCFLVTSVF